MDTNPTGPGVPAPALEAVAYLSTACEAMSEAQLERLLRTARERNLDHGITGVLLHHDGTFFQYFEGPPRGVARVYDHIRRSPQHHDLVELVHAPIRERVFPEWLMGFTRAPASLLLQLSDAPWRASLLGPVVQRTDSDGLSLLLQFWRTSRQPLPR